MREFFNPSRHEVRIIPEADAKAFVVSNHYSGTYPAARLRLGLFDATSLRGVAVFSHPTSNKVLTNVFDCNAREAVELGRFVLHDEPGHNAESWFLGRCFRHLKHEGYQGLIAFSDPVPRYASDGEQVFQGHIGTIYQATNARYLGRATARTLYILPDGSVFSARAAQKIRSQDRGWRYAVEQLQKHGAAPFTGCSRQWLSSAMNQVCRRVRHRGNHRYAWALRKGVIKGSAQPYPKAHHSRRLFGGTAWILPRETSSS